MSRRKIIEKLQGMGINLMPLAPFSKKPLADWQRLQTEKYTGEFPENCNIAVICGKISNNLFVLDLDSKELFDEFKEYHDKTFTTITGKRGYHFYFRQNTLDLPNRKFDDKRGRHIDLQSDGKYVLAPTSIHPDTKREYEILYDKSIMIIDPFVLKDKLKALGFNVERTPIEEIKNGIKEGGRNNSMFKYGCYLIREQGLYGAGLTAEMERVNQLNEPPLPDSELKTIIGQCLRYESHNIKESTPNTPKEKIEPISVTIQDITPALEGIPIIFDSLIIAAGERMTYMKWATYECAKCGKSERLECDEYHEITTPYCKKCKDYYDVVDKETEFVQEIRIQEFLENAKQNTPVEYNAEIFGRDVGEAFISQRKKFTAVFRSVKAKDENRAMPLFEITKMEALELDTSCMPSKEEVERWKSQSNIFDIVRDSIAPELYMNPAIIESCMLAIAGGTSLNGKRENIHIGIYGDAQLGKSELLKRLHETQPGSAYVVGKQSSGAGLTIGMVKLFNGTMSPKAGVLPTHAGRLVCIDEVDKSKPEDRDSLLESMEQGYCSLAKAGYPNVRLPTNNIIIDAGNPKNGKYNSKLPSIMDNFSFNVPFVTRHDVIWLLVDQNDPDLDNIIMKHIQDFEKNKEKYLKLSELQKFFAHVSTIEAIIPNDIKPVLDDLYRRMRKFNKSDGIPIGLRQYYGLYRLVTASAACHLRDTVTNEDLIVVERVIKESLKSLKMNLDTGESEPILPSKQSEETIFLETIKELQDGNKTFDKKEFLNILSSKERFTPDKADKWWEKYSNRGRFEINNDTGRWRLVTL